MCLAFTVPAFYVFAALPKYGFRRVFLACLSGCSKCLDSWQYLERPYSHAIVKFLSEDLRETMQDI